MGKEGKKEMNHWVLQERGLLKNIYILFLCNIKRVLTSCKMVYSHLLTVPGVPFKEAKSFSLQKVIVCLGLWINDRSGTICAPKGPLVLENNEGLKD